MITPLPDSLYLDLARGITVLWNEHKIDHDRKNQRDRWTVILLEAICRGQSSKVNEFESRLRWIGWGPAADLARKLASEYLSKEGG